MRIDVHAHVMPPAFARRALGRAAADARSRTSPGLFDLGARVADLDRLGVGVQVVSLGPPGCVADTAAARTALAQRFNDELAALVKAHPERYRGLATLPMWDVDEAVREARRAVEELGLSGVQVFTTYDDRPIDATELWPVFETVEALGVPMLVHPDSSSCATRLDDVGRTVTLGFVHETTVCASRLVVRGVLAAFPRLDVVLCHLGGYLPYVVERFVAVAAARTRMGREAAWRTDEDVRSLLGRFWIDTVSHHAPAYRCAIDTWDPARIVLGSDYPYSDWSACVAEIESLGLDDALRDAVLGGNAMNLLDMTNGGR